MAQPQPKSKKDNNLTLVGLLDLSDLTITETVRDYGDVTFNILEELAEFNNKEITLVVREKKNILPEIDSE